MSSGMSKFYRWFAALGVAAAAAATIPAAQAQQFPNRPIELIVPYSAGGGSGITAEVMKKIITEEKLSPQPVNITYKPGASGQVGWTYLATKKGDAHTIATATASFSYGMVLKQMQVGPEHFTPIAQIRTAKYIVGAFTIAPGSSFDEITAAEPESVGAIGEEAAGFFDFDISF